MGPVLLLQGKEPREPVLVHDSDGGCMTDACARCLMCRILVAWVPVRGRDSVAAVLAVIMLGG